MNVSCAVDFVDEAEPFDAQPSAGDCGGDTDEQEHPLLRAPLSSGSQGCASSCARVGTDDEARPLSQEHALLRAPLSSGSQGCVSSCARVGTDDEEYDPELLNRLGAIGHLDPQGFSAGTSAKIELIELENHKRSFLRAMRKREQAEQGRVATVKIPVDGAIADLSSMPQLDMSHGANEELSLRLQMLHAEQYHRDEMGNLRMMLDGAGELSDLGEGGRSTSASGTFPASKTATTKKRGPPLKKAPTAIVKLDAIDEGDNEVGSEDSGRSHFNVSSLSDTSGDNLGDLEDFDENDIVDLMFQENLEAKKEIQKLREEVALHKKRAQDLQIETAAKKAHYESKIIRLTQQLDQEHKNHALTKEKLVSNIDESVSESMADEDGADSQHMEIAKMLEAAQVRNASLQEGKRIAEARVEDLKRAVALEQQKRKQVAEELTQRFPNTGSGGSEPATMSELLDLRNRLKSTEEDKNVLINTFEGKEVHWQTQIENAQLEMEEMKRKHAGELQKLESMLAAQVHEPMAERRAAARGNPYRSPSPDPQAVQVSSLFAILRCPTRAPTGGPKPAFCQEFCWKVLSAVTGKLVLWCSVRDYTILEASREANVVWGSSLLVGKSIFSLASGPSSAAWLKKAFHCHMRMTERDDGGQDQDNAGASGFVVRGLGCEAFVSKTGESFDSSVMMAYFPAEVACNRSAALLVVIDPMKSNTTANQGPGTRPSMKPASRVSSTSMHSAHRRLHPRSSQSEVSQSSVTPSDSASNVLGF